MGLLAEGKSKRRINKDPNNTKWTRDTTTFGQKILRAQGWQPGQFLGAQDAPHSELHTAANASYIRVALKDDMKGLGFSKSKEDEVTGLDVFQDLLSRLNGKSEEAVEEDKQARLAVKTHHFVEQRWGPMRFVYGGLLVGDDMKDLPQSDESKASDEGEEEEDDKMEVDAEPKAKKEKKSKKRKVSDEVDTESGRESDSKSKKRRKEESKKSKTSDDSDDDKKAKKKEKKSKKDKSKSKDSGDESNSSDEVPKKRKSKSKSRSASDTEEDKSKEARRAAKKEKKEKKEKKKRRKEAEAGAESSSAEPASAVQKGTSTPTTGTSTPRPSRNFVRSRFIAQKRQAVLDTKALNQIFMVKA